MKVNLVLFKKSGFRKSFPLASSVTVVGRRRDCDLCIPLMVVSRRHCELNQDMGRLTLRDMGSSNGTLLNGKRVEESIVKAGDIVFFGKFSGTEADQEHLILREDEVLGIVEK